MSDLVADRISTINAIVVDWPILLELTEPVIPERGCLAGPNKMNWEGFNVKMGRRAQLGEDGLHFPPHYGTLTRLGFTGIRDAAIKNARGKSGEEAAYLNAIAQTFDAITKYCVRHAEAAERKAASATGAEKTRLKAIADTCRALSLRAPRTVREGMQAVWLLWAMRCGTIGRLDQHLFPLYQAELAAGTITRDEALQIIIDLWRCLNHGYMGDTLMNVMLGGQDAAGNDATNEISYLMLEATRVVAQSEPHINVRIHKNTPDSFKLLSQEIILMGQGQGTVYNDELIIPMMVNYGVPLTSARNYANDGCSELTIDGECLINLMSTECLKILEITLFNGRENPSIGEWPGQYWTRTETPRALKTDLELGIETGDFTKMNSFDEFYAAFVRQHALQTERRLRWIDGYLTYQREKGITFPLTSALFPKCLETGIDPYRGDYLVPVNTLFSGEVTATADALAAIKKVVFEDKACTPAELLEALSANWEGHEELRRRCLAAPKFGNDDDYVDLIAADIASRFCTIVANHKDPSQKSFWPALFCHDFVDLSKLTYAMPCGRRWGDPLGEHFGPAPGRAKKGPTAIMRSVTKAPLDRACGVSVFHISLSRDSAPRTLVGRNLIGNLIDSAISMGVATFNIAIYDVEELRDAKLHPERHEDLIVRVWGFSAQFVALSDDMQNHIIGRILAEKE